MAWEEGRWDGIVARSSQEVGRDIHRHGRCGIVVLDMNLLRRVVAAVLREILGDLVEAQKEGGILEVVGLEVVRIRHLDNLMEEVPVAEGSTLMVVGHSLDYNLLEERGMEVVLNCCSTF